MGSLTTSYTEVGATSITLHYDLFTLGISVETGDYLLIELPTTSDAEFETSGTPVCDATPLTVIKCKILSNLRA